MDADVYSVYLFFAIDSRRGKIGRGNHRKEMSRQFIPRVSSFMVECLIKKMCKISNKKITHT